MNESKMPSPEKGLGIFLSAQSILPSLRWQPSVTDQPAIVFRDDDGGRTWSRRGAARAIACIARPVAKVFGRVRDGRLGDGFTRVLDVDEDGLAVGRFGDAGDFAIHRPDQKTLERIGGWFGAEPV